MLEIRNLSLHLGEFHFENLSLRVETGEYCVILGPTGAGKTILLETIAGIHHPDSGSILLDGRDITLLSPEKRGIGMVYQDYMLFPHMTVRENIAFGLRQAGRSPAERNAVAGEMAKTLGIDQLLDRYPSTLSGGEQQRTALARALVLRPGVLLLDEPLSALDTATRERLRQELRRLHQATGTTILHITHHFEDMYALADRVLVLRDGSIAQEGTPEAILRQPASDFIAGFTGMENLFSGVSVSRSDGSAEILLDGVKVYAVSDISGPVRAGIRPEDLIISQEPFSSSARNSLLGTVLSIADSGMYTRLTVDTGILLTAAVTRQSVQKLGLIPGSKVWMTFKATAVHVFPVSG